MATRVRACQCACSLPVAYRLYLPRPWTDAQEHHGKTGIPDDVVFKTPLPSLSAHECGAKQLLR
jgi:hypothetical protein